MTREFVWFLSRTRKLHKHKEPSSFVAEIILSFYIMLVLRKTICSLFMILIFLSLFVNHTDWLRPNFLTWIQSPISSSSVGCDKVYICSSKYTFDRRKGSRGPGPIKPGGLRDQGGEKTADASQPLNFIAMAYSSVRLHHLLVNHLRNFRFLCNCRVSKPIWCWAIFYVTLT